MDTFSFLCEHATRRYCPERWAELLGFRIIDADGWRGRFDDFEQPCGLLDFIDRAKRCTIGPKE